MSYSYDPLNRLLAKSASDSSVNDSYVYDWGIGPNEVGHLSWVEHFGIAATAFFYDAMGHVASTGLYAPGMSWRSGNGLVYGLSGSPYYISYPSGQGITESHDAAGRLTSVTSSNTGLPFFSNALYTAAGTLSSATYGNGVTEAITYNSRLQPCHTLANSAAVAPMTGYGNVYDRVSSYANSPTSSSPCNAEPGNNGNIAYISDNLTAGWTQSFSYDGLNRLLTASRSDAGYSHNYNYDSFGNLLVHDNISPSLTANFSISSGTNQLDRINPITSTSLYAYDAAGNLTSSDTSMGTGTSSIGGHAFTYNALSQINSVDGGATATYTYDGQDERVNKTTGTTWTDYIYFSGQPMSELASDGTVSNYIYANGQKIVKMTIPSGGAVTLNYYLNDHLGTSQVELDASGNVTWQGQFTPFGSELPDGSTAMHYKFTGKERDAESGLDFFGARYYASPTGRWMSPDWAEKPEDVPYAKMDDPQSLNLYGYVGNNPLSKNDLDGHQQCTCEQQKYDRVASQTTDFFKNLGHAIADGGRDINEFTKNPALTLVTAAATLTAAAANKLTPAAPKGATPAPAAAPAAPGTQTAAPPLPTGLVGVQDGKGGPQGKRHNSGPLAPENGGTGDAGADFGRLTGGRSGPAPQGGTYPSGTQVGENGAALRPTTGNSGPRIEIPENGPKPHETLHYPKP